MKNSVFSQHLERLDASSLNIFWVVSHQSQGDVQPLQ
jgi:hypothetical protein